MPRKVSKKKTNVYNVIDKTVIFLYVADDDLLYRSSQYQTIMLAKYGLNQMYYQCHFQLLRYAYC